MIGNIFILFVLLTLIIDVSTVQIQSINNAIFTPISSSNFIIVHNRSKNECLCLAVSQNILVNYFQNGTCQIFTTIPCGYQVRLQTQVELYLFNQSVSLTPQSCAANLSLLIKKLNNTVPNNLNITKPRCLVIDNHGYLVTVSITPSLLVRYNLINLTLIDQTSLIAPAPLTITFHDEAYYIAFNQGNITVINSNTLATNNMITSTYISKPRDIIFINNGNTMIVASSGNNFLVFLNRSNATSTYYTYAYRVSFSHSGPHGLWHVNDSFFYVTSYNNNTILSYSFVNSTTWFEKLVVDARNRVPISGGAHVTVDPHDRLWFSLQNGNVLIYDNQGIYLQSFFYPSVPVYDLLITDNYTIYLSSDSSDRVLRFDSNIDD